MNDAQRTAIEKKWGEALKGLHPAGPCLTAQELIEVAERGDRARNYAQHVEHLASCQACREAVQEMTEADQVRRLTSTTPAFWSWLTWPRLAFAIPAAAAIVFCAVLLANSGWIGGVRGQEPIASNHGESEKRQPPGPLPEGNNKNNGTRIVQEGPKKDAPEPGDDTSPRPRIRTTLVASNWEIRNGRHTYNGIELPKEIQSIAGTLTDGPTVVRGAETGVLRMAPSPKNPVSNWLEEPMEGNMAVLSGKPSFRLARDKAESRSAKLYEISGNGERAELPNALVVTGGDRPLAPLTAALKQGLSLSPGREYILEVGAMTSEIIGGTEVESERATAWRFRIFSGREHRIYTWAKSNEKRLPVAAALSFHRLRQFGDAERVANLIDKLSVARNTDKRQPIEASLQWHKWRVAIGKAYEHRVANPDQ